jgi:ubiquinone/menaquinone biosynthesis C-methylase UbiE
MVRPVPAVPEERWQRAQQSERRFWANFGLARFRESTAGSMQTAMWARKRLNVPVGDWLDVGIGPLGVGATHFLEPPQELHTIEPIELVAADKWSLPEACKVLTRYCQGRSTTHMGQAEHLAFPDDSFALVSMENMLDHVEDPRKALVEARRVLRPDGRLLLAIHTFSILGETRYRIKKPFKAKQGKTFWAAHPHRFSSKGIQDLVKSSGFQIADIDTSTPVGAVVGHGYLTRLIAV